MVRVGAMGPKRVAYGPKQTAQMPALGYEDYKRVIQRSWVHVYWTVPFILSWSLMEAMASAAASLQCHPRQK